MSNVIYRGPVEREPETINLPVAGAYLPGIFVTSDGAELTQAADGMLRIIAWYDNEWGYINRLVDLLAFLKEMGP